MATRAVASIEIVPSARGGRPAAHVTVPTGTSLSDAGATIQKYVTRNSDLLKKVGLKACPGCISGFDIWIRFRYENVLEVDVVAGK